ncbi:MAG TPA: hypothetical protein DDY51_16495, partial [Erwinia persicina]|nr:hypothetical protein [Erwinia persicina]
YINGLVTENAQDYSLIHRIDADAIVIEDTLSAETYSVISQLRKRHSCVISQIISPSWIIAQGRHLPEFKGIDRLIVQN